MTLVQAQERTYSGVVKGSDGQPIIGASVEVVGTTVGTSTGLDGDSHHQSQPREQNQILFPGYEVRDGYRGYQLHHQRHPRRRCHGIGRSRGTGFRYRQEKDLTGAVSSIDSKLISSQSNSTLSRALEGAIPGLQVASIDGQPGVDMGIRVRGIGSGTQNNSDALIVIDGVPNTNSNALSSLNPKDIESITVLKDAASTALWGSRGANGVVMVTTKKGQQGRAKVTFEGRWGINQQGPFTYEKIDDPASLYEWAWQSIYNTARFYGGKNFTTNVKNPNMSHEEAALFASQHLFDAPALGKTSGFAQNSLGNYMLYNVPGAKYISTGSGSSASSTMTGAYLIDPMTGKLNPNAELLYWDPWDGHFLQNRFRQEYNVSVSGATDKTDYFISAGYLEDPSYIQGSSFNRYNVRSNINSQITKWLKAGINMAYSRRAVQSPATRYGRNPGSAVANVFRWVNGQSSLIPLFQRNADGSYILDAAGNKTIHLCCGTERIGSRSDRRSHLDRKPGLHPQPRQGRDDLERHQHPRLCGSQVPQRLHIPGQPFDRPDLCDAQPLLEPRNRQCRIDRRRMGPKLQRIQQHQHAADPELGARLRQTPCGRHDRPRVQLEPRLQPELQDAKFDHSRLPGIQELPRTERRFYLQRHRRRHQRRSAGRRTSCGRTTTTITNTT
ncbi:MAG: TonB-dependent receptor plug domain-containing protein [Alistipes indistinctus]